MKATSGSKTEAGRGTGPDGTTLLSGEERSDLAILRDESAKLRDENAALRDELAALRDEVAAGRQTGALGAVTAEQRDHAARQRDGAAEERDELAERTEAGPDTLSGGDKAEQARDARRLAASDRRRSEADRVASATERVDAGVDRIWASSDRAAAAAERVDAEVDRDWARSDRVAAAAELIESGRARSSERLRAAKANARFASLVEYSANAILVIEPPAAIVVYASPGLAAISGIPTLAATGSSFVRLLHPDDVLRVDAIIVDLSSKFGQVVGFACRLGDVAGGWCPVEVTATNLMNDPAVEGIALNIRDVSYRIAAGDQAADKLRALDRERQGLADRLRESDRLENLWQLAGGVAHDFNNLLGVILSYAEFVVEATAELPEVRADVAHIQVAAESAAALTRALTTFAHRETLQVGKVDLNLVVTGLEERLSRTTGKNIRLILEPGRDVPTISADREQIEQVLINLTANSVDAMAAGGTLTIETASALLDAEYVRNHPGITPGRYAELRVSDTGSGMSTQVAAHALEPFFTTRPRGKGLGLGLTTAHDIARAGAGMVNIYSEESIGTTISVYLRASEADGAHGGQPASGEGPKGHGESILVVDDEPALLDVTSRILERNGYQVSKASTYEEAMALCADHGFALLLTDVVMPEISGPRLAELIVSAHPGLPVLYMSGYSVGVLGPALLLQDGVALVQKPFTQRTLLDKVRETLVG